MSGLDDVAGGNRRGNRGELVAKIDDSTESADALTGSNQRRNRPSDRGCRGQTSDGNADPEKRGDRTVSAGSAENSQAKAGPTDENDLTNANGIPAALHQRVDKPPANDQVGQRREQPRNTGVQNRMK